MENLKEKLTFILSLSDLKPDNVKDVFEKNFNKWLYMNSSDAVVNGNNVKGLERFLLMLPDTDGKPSIKTLEKSDTTEKGFELKKQTFINEELQTLIPLYEKTIGSVKNREKNLMLELYIDYLKGLQPKKIELSDNSNEFFTTALYMVRMKAIHKYLFDEKYINVDIDSWLYWFGLQSWTNKKKKPQKIKWLAASYILSNVISIICGNFKNDTESTMKKVFILQKGANFQNKTNIDRTKAPYKELYQLIEWAEKAIN